MRKLLRRLPQQQACPGMDGVDSPSLKLPHDRVIVTRRIRAQQRKLETTTSGCGSMTSSGVAALACQQRHHLGVKVDHFVGIAGANRCKDLTEQTDGDDDRET